VIWNTPPFQAFPDTKKRFHVSCVGGAIRNLPEARQRRRVAGDFLRIRNIIPQNFFEAIPDSDASKQIHQPESPMLKPFKNQKRGKFRLRHLSVLAALAWARESAAATIDDRFASWFQA